MTTGPAQRPVHCEPDPLEPGAACVDLDPSALLVALPVCVVSLVLHECAHGWAALGLGDPTARRHGRLTLNPIPHLHPIGSLVVPGLLVLAQSALLFGWAKPIPLDRARLRDLRNGPTLVALAGPATSFLLALAFAALARVAPTEGFAAPLRLAGYAGVAWNCALGLFNLIPIPPLDGSWVLMRFLRLRHIVALHHFRFAAFAIVAVLLAAPLSSRWFFQAPHRLAMEACLGLFGLQPLEAAR